jgi:hypothetical protein
MSASFSGRVNVVMYHSKNGINTKANVRTRMAMSHFLAIPGLEGASEDAEETSAVFVIVVIALSLI